MAVTKEIAKAEVEKQQFKPFKTELPPHLQEFLHSLRQHPLFPELLKFMQPQMRVPRYSPARHATAEEANANWIFWSGQWAHYETVHRMMTGTNPSSSEDK